MKSMLLTTQHAATWTRWFALAMCAVALGAHAACRTDLGASATPSADFTVNANGTVVHGPTGLMWKQCNEGLSGVNCGTGTASVATWAAALSAAKNSSFAGYTDWRLPNKQELESLIDDTCSSPAINSTVFPGTVANYTWISTTDAAVPALVPLVSFAAGNTLAHAKTIGSFVVRLVRSGQSFDTLASAASGLVGYWNFDDCTASDSSGLSNSGTLVGSPTCVASSSGRGIRLNSTNHAEIPDGNSLDLTNELTISAWFNADVLPTDRPVRLVDKITAGFGDGYMLDVRRDLIRFSGGTAGAAVAVPAISLNVFHHVAVTVNQGTTRFFLDGLLVGMSASGTSSVVVNSLPLRIGAAQGLDARQSDNFAGIIDEVRIYNRALSAVEVAALAMAPAAVNGTCGTANNVAVATAPTTNLCATGTATPVTGTGPWNWTCNGSGGGTSASCSAPLLSSLSLRSVAYILPSSVQTEAQVMRGGRGYRWFQALETSGAPLANAVVSYRYVRDGATTSALTQTVNTDADGLFVVSTPALTTGALGARINFNLLVDRIAQGSRVALTPWPALPFDYVLGARSLEQSWNVEVKADLTGSIGPQVGGSARVGNWGATARAGSRLSGALGVGESVTWTHSVSGYGDFDDPAHKYLDYTNTAPLTVGIDGEVGGKVGTSADARLGAGAINRGLYAGVGVGGEIAGAFGAGFEYKFPTFFAPGSNDEACPMTSLTLAAIKPSAGSVIGQFGCASPLSGFFNASATRWKGSATVNAGAYLSTKQLNKQRSDGNYDSHFAFVGVTGEAGGIYENKLNKDGTRAIKKQLFAKLEGGVSITPPVLVSTRSVARAGEKLLSDLSYERTVTDSVEYTKLTKYDTLDKATAVTLSLSLGRADGQKVGFSDVSLAGEAEVSEKLSIHSRNAADAQALADNRASGEVQFDRLPIVQKIKQIHSANTSPPPGFIVPPGYFIEREGVTTPIELAFEVEGAFAVGLDLSVSATAEGVTTSLTERGTVAAYNASSGGAIWKPLLLESYPIADSEIEGLRISPSAIAGKVGAALNVATRNLVQSVGGAVESAGNQLANGTSALVSTAGSYAASGWRFVLTKGSAILQNQIIESTRLKAVSSQSQVIGSVHFVNLLDPSNLNVEAFPSPFTLKIGDVLASLNSAGVPANQASRLVLMRFDRATGQAIVVPGALAGDQNSYSATVQYRGAYFLVYDAEVPLLTQLVAGVSQTSPRVVMIAGSFDNRDLTGLNAASFSVKVDGVEVASAVGTGSMINARTGEFRVPVGAGALAAGIPARVVVTLADGAGNVAQQVRCAYAVAADVLLKPTTATTCAALSTGTLNITGSTSPDRSIDVVLLTRYLLGFRGTSLTAGLTITGTRTSAADIANFIGNALVFDVVARENVGTPHPMIDTLILLRLAQGMSDDALLSGIQIPNGAGMTTASGIRALVNAKFGTTY